MDLPLTAAVKSDCHVAGPILLDLKITNVTDHTRCFFYFDPVNRFAIWLLHDGKQVPLTEYGEAQMPRYTVMGGIAGGPSEILPVGSTKEMQIDLLKEFQITKSGPYTLIVEEGPGYDDNNPRREVEAVKTSFTVRP